MDKASPLADKASPPPNEPHDFDVGTLDTLLRGQFFHTAQRIFYSYSDYQNPEVHLTVDWLYPPADWLYPSADWLYPHAHWLNSLCHVDIELANKASPLTYKASPL